MPSISYSKMKKIKEGYYEMEAADFKAVIKPLVEQGVLTVEQGNKMHRRITEKSSTTS